MSSSPWAHLAHKVEHAVDLETGALVAVTLHGADVGDRTSLLATTLTAAEQLAAVQMLRWRIERDYQELKDELGLDQFEGRGWRGFHHHASLCIAAYAFWPRSGWRSSPPGMLNVTSIRGICERRAAFPGAVARSS